MSQEEVIEIFKRFLSHHVLVVPRRQENSEVLYWAVRYKTLQEGSNLNAVPVGTIQFDCSRINVYIPKSDKNPEPAKEVINAFGKFRSNFPEFCGRLKLE